MAAPAAAIEVESRNRIPHFPIPLRSPDVRILDALRPVVSDLGGTAKMADVTNAVPAGIVAVKGGMRRAT